MNNDICPECDGNGWIVLNDQIVGCDVCEGTGRLPDDEELQAQLDSTLPYEEETGLDKEME